MRSGDQLAGRVALITGGGGEIAGAIARQFVLQGAAVMLADFRLDAAEATAAKLNAEGGSARATASASGWAWPWIPSPSTVPGTSAMVSIKVGLRAGRVRKAKRNPRTISIESSPGLSMSTTPISGTWVSWRDAMNSMPVGQRRITLSATTDDNSVQLHVADTGTGVPDEILPRIFEPFFTTKSPNSGTGLGLSICHGAMRTMGGDISVRNDPAGGAIFTLTFRTAEAITAAA